MTEVKSGRRLKLVLGLRFEVAGVVAFVKLARRVSEGPVDHPSALHGRALRDLVGPALDVLVVLHLEEFAGLIDQPLGERAIPGPGRDIGNRVFAAAQIFAFAEPPVEAMTSEMSDRTSIWRSWFQNRWNTVSW